MRDIQVQAKIEKDLFEHISKILEDKEVKMSSYIRKALIQRSKYTPKAKV